MFDWELWTTADHVAIEFSTRVRLDNFLSISSRIELNSVWNNADCSDTKAFKLVAFKPTERWVDFVSKPVPPPPLPPPPLRPFYFLFYFTFVVVWFDVYFESESDLFIPCCFSPHPLWLLALLRSVAEEGERKREKERERERKREKENGKESEREREREREGGAYYAFVNRGKEIWVPPVDEMETAGSVVRHWFGRASVGVCVCVCGRLSMPPMS